MVPLELKPNESQNITDSNFSSFYQAQLLHFSSRDFITATRLAVYISMDAQIP
jgi:hypothetical protein